jgi:hypothetical protein
MAFDKRARSDPSAIDKYTYIHCSTAYFSTRYTLNIDLTVYRFDKHGNREFNIIDKLPDGKHAGSEANFEFISGAKLI